MKNLLVNTAVVETMKKTLMATCLCLWLSPALAQEACDPADLKGEWRYFTFSDLFDPDLNLNLPGIDGCIAIMSARGTFRSGSECLISVLRANLDVRRNCTIRGKITQRFDDGSLLECAVSGAITRDREFISGVAVCVEDDLVFPTMWNMVRGRKPAQAAASDLPAPNPDGRDLSDRQGNRGSAFD